MVIRRKSGKIIDPDEGIRGEKLRYNEQILISTIITHVCIIMLPVTMQSVDYKNLTELIEKKRKNLQSLPSFLLRSVY